MSRSSGPRRRRPRRRARRVRRHQIEEFVVVWALKLAAFISVVTTISIIVILIKESIPFFREVPIWDFLTGTSWTPNFNPASFGVLPLIAGTQTEPREENSSKSHTCELLKRTSRNVVEPSSTSKLYVKFWTEDTQYGIKLSSVSNR